jgi:TonB family protein
MPSMKIWGIALAAHLALASPVSAQVDTKGLETLLRGRQFELRNYSADAVVPYTWVSGTAVPGPVQLHGLVAFIDDSVKLKKGGIVFSGSRVVLTRKASGLVAIGMWPMKLEVDLKGADPATVFPQLQAALFFPDLQSAIDGLPPLVANILPFPSEGKFHPTVTHSTTIFIFKDGEWKAIDNPGPRFSAPRILKIENPEFTEEARQQKISGDVYLVFTASQSGGVDEIWLARPLGFGLDEAAAKAVRKYQLAPAQLDGQPVGSILIVNVNFQIF